MTATRGSLYIAGEEENRRYSGWRKGGKAGVVGGGEKAGRGGRGKEDAKQEVEELVKKERKTGL